MRRKSLLLEKSRVQPVAANGLLDRRAFLSGGAAMAAGFTPYALARPARGEPLKDDPWSLGPGNLTGPYEQRSRFEDKVVRTLSNPKGEPCVQNAPTPLHLMQGTITPAGRKTSAFPRRAELV
jgi:sulfane dehydrogenase subunit SoxC